MRCTNYCVAYVDHNVGPKRILLVFTRKYPDLLIFVNLIKFSGHHGFDIGPSRESKGQLICEMAECLKFKLAICHQLFTSY